VPRPTTRSEDWKKGQRAGIRSTLARLRRWLLGPTDSELVETIIEFRRTFPDLGPVCSHARWGRSMAIESAWPPPPHDDCPEARASRA
jgi:hypothetical protein